MNKRKAISYLAVILILVGTYFSFQALSDQKKAPRQRAKPEVKNYVRVVSYEPLTIATTIEAYGRLATSKQLNVIAEVGGKLFGGNVVLKRGQRFKKGQLMCRIDNVEEKLNLQAQKSNFLNTLASVLPDIKVDFPENFSIWQQYFDRIELTKLIPSLPEARTSKEKTFMASQNILSEYYAIKSEEAHLKKFTIYAPFNGSIINVNFETGSVVNAGTNIATIIRTDKLELEIPIEIRDIQYIELGTKVKVISDTQEAMEWDGAITRIADFVDPNTQSISVFIAIKKHSKYEALDGLFLKAVITGKTIEQAVRIPRNILKNKDEVFVVENGLLKTKKLNIHKLGERTAISGSGRSVCGGYAIDRFRKHESRNSKRLSHAKGHYFFCKISYMGECHHFDWCDRRDWHLLFQFEKIFFSGKGAQKYHGIGGLSGSLSGGNGRGRDHQNRGITQRA